MTGMGDYFLKYQSDQIKMLRAALVFYADSENHKPMEDHGGASRVHVDGGKIARDALSGEQG